MDGECVDGANTAKISSTVEKAMQSSLMVAPPGGEVGPQQQQQQQNHHLSVQNGHHYYQPQHQYQQQVLDVAVQMTTTGTTTTTMTASPLPPQVLPPPPPVAAAAAAAAAVDHGNNTSAVNMNNGGFVSTTVDGYGIATALMVAGLDTWNQTTSVSNDAASHDRTNNYNPTTATAITTATVATDDNNSNDDNSGRNTDTSLASGGRYSGVLYGEAIHNVQEMDVLNGRGAAINARPGNKKFRALCFAHKALFDAGNHAAKRRIAAEIVSKMIDEHQSRFLRLPKTTKKKNTDSKKYFAMTFDQAILKAQQIMRDYKRPDRMPVAGDIASARTSIGIGSNIRPKTVQHRTITEQKEKEEEDEDDYNNHGKSEGGDKIVPPTTPNGTSTADTASVAVKKLLRTRSVESTPMVDVVILDVPSEPLIENPSGVHSHDVLSGRGAFVNGHVGNETLRKLALERKAKFHSGSHITKKELAKEIFEHIRRLDPPGRFLRKVDLSRRLELEKEGKASTLIGDEWEELGNDKAITKCCQTMRDIGRPDRQDRRGKQREEQKRKKNFKTVVPGQGVAPNSEINGSNIILHEGRGAHYQGPIVNMGPSSELVMHPHNANVTNELLTKLAEKAAVEALEGVVDAALHGTRTDGILHSATTDQMNLPV